MGSGYQRCRATGTGLLVVLALSAAGCGGTMEFKGETPFSLSYNKPPPPAKPKRVEVVQDRIEIKEKIQFEFDDSTIKAESHDLLNEIVQVLQDNPQIKEVDIVGHTDAQGRDSHNQELSEARANSVMTYLTEHGVAEGRLRSEGKGESAPIADNETDAGREKNRRVEFKITKQETVKKMVEVVDGQEDDATSKVKKKNNDPNEEEKK